MRLVGLLLLAACAPPVDPPPVTGTVELGTGADEFTVLEDGAELELIPGAQGGFHVSILIRVGGFDGATDLAVERSTRRDDTGDLVATTTFRSTFGEGGMLAKTVPVFLCPAPVGIGVADQPLEVSATVTAEDGTAGVGSAAFVPRCPAGDHADFCDRICRR